MSTTDERPSIVELRMIAIEQSNEDIAELGYVCNRCRDSFAIGDLDPTTVCDLCAQYVVSDVLPVLLEIAAAAQALGSELQYLIGPASKRLQDALARVRR